MALAGLFGNRFSNRPNGPRLAISPKCDFHTLSDLDMLRYRSMSPLSNTSHSQSIEPGTLAIAYTAITFSSRLSAFILGLWIRSRARPPMTSNTSSSYTTLVTRASPGVARRASIVRPSIIGQYDALTLSLPSVPYRNYGRLFSVR